jgi:hypothetical protein
MQRCRTSFIWAVSLSRLIILLFLWSPSQ